MRDPLYYRDDAPVTAPVLALADFIASSNTAAVRLEPADDPRALMLHLDRLALVEIAFPSFRDGRGYSHARVLREAGYAGDLRAAGDVLVDQLLVLRRCGFDSFAPNAAIDAAAAERALSRYAHVYQAAADGATPVWKLRHG